MVHAMEANLSDLLSFKSLFNSKPAPATDPPATNSAESRFDDEPVSISRQAQIAYSQSQSHQSLIEIQTRDGDKISIQLQQASNYQASHDYSYQQTTSGKQVTYSSLEAAQSSSSIQVHIEGKLDNDEREAIEDLIEDIGKITHQLYQGNTNTAFKLASKLEFDTDELQSYSFDTSLTTTKTMTAAYEEVARYQPDHTRSVPEMYHDNDIFDALKEQLSSSIDAVRKFIDSDNRQSLFTGSKDFFEQNLKPLYHQGIDITDLVDADD